MITAFFETLHTKIASLWGNVCAWATAGGVWLYGGMEPITAIGATLACILTAVSIVEKLHARRDVADLKRAIQLAEETGLDQLRDAAADMLERRSKRRRK
jgi:hypothetical protein